MFLYCLLGITNSKLDGLVGYYPTYNLRALHLFWFVSKAIVEVEMQTSVQIVALLGMLHVSLTYQWERTVLLRINN